MTPPVISSVPELRRILGEQRQSGSTVGFVPTMGYLHAGHASLMQAARRDCDYVVSSIFVNPLQFGVDEDLGDYPRDLERDCALADSSGVDLLFVPSVEEMYPSGAVQTKVGVPGIAALWEGATRPTHFSGVATVVSKLFNIFGPCRAYFGEKDFQQLAIIRRMVADLSIPVEIVGCPIIREQDGLAMSSRNVYLKPDEREAATVLRLALDAGEAMVIGGVLDPHVVMRAMRSVVEGEPLAALDYAAAVDSRTLRVPESLEGIDVRLLVAAQVGRPRLIDNTGVKQASRTAPE